MKHRYTRIAKTLIQANHETATAQRYLDVLRRQKKIERTLVAISAECIPEKHKRRAIQRLPGAANRLVLIRHHLEQQLDAAVVNLRTPRFIAILPKYAVEEAMAGHQDRSDIIVGCRGGLRFCGTPADTTFSRGSGLVVIRRDDLQRLLDVSKAAITIEAFVGHWVGWADSCPSGAPGGRPMQPNVFSYWESVAVE